MSLALTPVVAVAIVALGPGTAGGETVLASGGHIHSHGSPESAIDFQPLPGGKGGRYVYKTIAKPHNTPIGIGLIVPRPSSSSTGPSAPAPAHGRATPSASRPRPRRGWHEPRPSPLVCALVAVGMLATGAGPGLRPRDAPQLDPARQRARRHEHAQRRAALLRGGQIVNRGDVTVVDGRGRPRRRRARRSTLRATARDRRPVARARCSRQLHRPLPRRLGRLARRRRRRSCSPSAGRGSGRRSSPAPAACPTRARPRSARASPSSPRSVLLLGLIAFRVLVWAPAVGRARGLREDEREIALAAASACSGAPSGRSRSSPASPRPRVLAAKSAVVFHTGIVAAALHPASAYRLVSASRFGECWAGAAARCRARRGRLRGLDSRERRDAVGRAARPVRAHGTARHRGAHAARRPGHASQAPSRRCRSPSTPPT